LGKVLFSRSGKASTTSWLPALTKNERMLQCDAVGYSDSHFRLSEAAQFFKHYCLYSSQLRVFVSEQSVAVNRQNEREICTPHTTELCGISHNSIPHFWNFAPKVFQYSQIINKNQTVD
jgi:hypothetical protein